MNDRLHDSTMLGHPELCYTDPVACGSKLLYLRHLAPHYPNLRRIVNMLYNICWVDRNLSSLDCALTKGNVTVLEQIVKEHKQSKSSYAVCDDGIDESKVMEEYSAAMVAFKKRCLDLPESPCMSCSKLCFRRDSVKLDSCLKPVTGDNWLRLLEYIDSHPGFDDGLPEGYICNYCIGKFREGLLPARCILNGLCFHAIPKEISDLNEYEKLLIQRAKAFQVVLRMNPVGGKKLPPSQQSTWLHLSSSPTFTRDFKTLTHS